VAEEPLEGFALPNLGWNVFRRRPPGPAMAAATQRALQHIEFIDVAFGMAFAHPAAMSKARPIHPGTTYLITRRTERRHCLLRPDAKMTQFILYAFVVSALRHGIQIHAFCAMSTHLHYVITDTRGELPRFLEMFHQLVARGVKTIRKWDGAVWDRRQTSAVALCTREAIIEKIAYTLANPVTAGLVHKAHEWPGAKTLANDIGQNKLQVQRPDVFFDPKNSDWELATELAVSMPPLPPEMDATIFREDIIRELRRLERQARAQYPVRSVLGAKRAMKIPPESRITSEKPVAQTNPTFAVGRGNTNEIRMAAITDLRAFRAAYREALLKWRAGDRSVVFPAGTYAMRVVHGVNVAT